MQISAMQFPRRQESILVAPASLTARGRARGEAPAEPDHSVQRQQCGQQPECPAERGLRRHLHPDGDDEQHHGPEAEESDDDVEVLAGADAPVRGRFRLPVLWCCSLHHLTAPAVRPATILRWNTSTRMTSGMVTMVPAAMMAVYGIWFGWAPAKLAMATVTGWVASLESWLAMRNSFHEEMKARIAVVKMAGAARGMMTLRKACPCVQPSTRADSSSSHGISRKKEVMV